MMKRGFVATLLTLPIAAFVACGSDEPTLTRKAAPAGDAGATDTNGYKFEPVGPEVYVPKVKSLLTGLPPTDAELQAVKRDPNALKGLIDAWMTLPSFKVRMTDFFRNAFQQNQVNLDQWMTNTGIGNIQIDGSKAGAQLERNMMDSFALTAWQIMYDGQPFNTTLTTRRYMMTTALASFISYSDEIRVGDEGKNNTNRLATRAPVKTYVLDTANNIPVAETFNPTSANFLHFTLPASAQPTGCGVTSQTMTAGTNDGNFYSSLFNTIFARAGFNPCGAQNGGSANTDNLYLTANEYNDWHWVTLHVDAAAPGTTPAFYEIEKLKTATDMTVHADRIGFFGTPAFVANWGTNVTNEMRVTANQALIVAAGQSIEGEDLIVNFPVDATDADHSANPACQGCHNQLDPFKQFFRQSYSLNYAEQTDKSQINATAGFAIGGLNQGGKGVSDLANIFASNPRFAVAWAGKLHFWANSLPAIETDPELLRVAAAFSGSNYDFKTLVRELFSSPLITWAAITETTKSGVINSIARRDQFCAALSNRLQLTDICGMISVAPTNVQSTIANRALLLPNDTYFRAYALASVPTNPDLFFRQATESICALVADQVVDAPNSKYSSTAPDEAIDDFVSNIMAIVPSDSRYAQAKAILADNFTQASTVGRVDKTTALKATFQLACLSPTSVMVGL